MTRDICIAAFGLLAALCMASPASAQTACADDSAVSNLSGTITSMTPQAYTAGSSSVPGHWITVTAPSLSCGGFKMYVLDARFDGLVGLDGHYCQVGGTITVNGTLFAPDSDDPNNWSFASSSMLPATYGADFTC